MPIRAYLEEAEILLSLKNTSNASERELVEMVGISKGTVHRMLSAARLPKQLKDAAILHDIEKYVLFDYIEMPKGNSKDFVYKQICKGKITTRHELWIQVHGYHTTYEQMQKKYRLPTVPDFLLSSIGQ